LLSGLLKRKYSDIEYKTFYKRADEFEVLFYGSSVVNYAITPMQLWHEYGITSYNMGNESERLTMTYYDILNSLDYASPKVIVVDLTAMVWAGTTRDNTLKDHNFIDAVPISVNKVREIKDVFGRDEYLEYLIPFTLYHSRWNELSQEDFAPNYHNVFYGVDLKQGTFPNQKPTANRYEESRFGDVESERVIIKKIINLCKERNIELFFTFLPTGDRGGDQKLREYCFSTMEEENQLYFDLLYIDTLDYSNDFFDSNHVNYVGAKKITEYLGRILTENYSLTDFRTDDNISDIWEKDYQEYERILNTFSNVQN
jgi:hypothetical protein